MAKMGFVVLYRIAMNNTYYTSGKDLGKKAAVLMVKTPAVVVLYPAGFVVGFVSAFLPERKKKEEQQEQEVAEVEVVLNPA
jgi:hypothetical protein